MVMLLDINDVTVVAFADRVPVPVMLPWTFRAPAHERAPDDTVPEKVPEDADMFPEDESDVTVAAPALSVPVVLREPAVTFWSMAADLDVSAPSDDSELTVVAPADKVPDTLVELAESFRKTAS